jgi:DNA invertase Pin-like site-specific DNA recombinase
MGVVVAVYSDVASAYAENAKRPDFEAALDDLRAGRIDGIAVWKVDRLVRRVSQFRRVLDTLESSGGRLFSLVEGIDTADPERKFVNGLILDLLVRLAEMESEGTSERLVLMAQDRARQGSTMGEGVAPSVTPWIGSPWSPPRPRPSVTLLGGFWTAKACTPSFRTGTPTALALSRLSSGQRKS